MLRYSKVIELVVYYFFPNLLLLHVVQVLTLLLFTASLQLHSSAVVHSCIRVVTASFDCTQPNSPLKILTLYCNLHPPSIPPSSQTFSLYLVLSEAAITMMDLSYQLTSILMHSCDHDMLLY